MRAFVLFVAITLFIGLFSVTDPLWAAPGDLDSSFGTGGIVMLDTYSRNTDSEDFGLASALLEDNGADSYVIAGYSVDGADRYAVVSRFHIDGSYVGKFGNRGSVMLDWGSGGLINDIIVDVKGNIIGCGRSGAATNGDSLFMRMSKNGSLDTGFAGDGTAAAGVKAQHDELKALAELADGSYVGVGTVESIFGNDFYIVKVDASGALDTSFGSNGIVSINFGDNDSAEAVAVDKSGTITVVGSTTNGSNNDLAVARLNADGTPDTSFSSDGKAVFDWSDTDIGYALILTTGNKTLIAGTSKNSDQDFLICRLDESGDLDADFGTAGKTLIDLGNNDIAAAFQINGDGFITLMGRSTKLGNDAQPATAQVDNTGDINELFAQDGSNVFSTGYSQFHCVDGFLNTRRDEIIVTGYARVDNIKDRDFGFVVFDSLGFYEQDWDKYTNDQTTKEHEYGRALLIHDDDSTTALVDSPDNSFDFRLNADGDMDYSFNSDGFHALGIISKSNLHEAARADDGTLFYGGSSFQGDLPFFTLAYRTPRNTIFFKDIDFGGDVSQICHSIALMSDDRPVFIGTVDSSIAVTRRLLNLSADPSFGTDGLVLSSFGDTCGANDGIILPDGSLIVAGSIRQGDARSFLFVKYNADGAVDESFGSEGKVAIPYGGSDYCRAVLLQPNGKILGCGISGTKPMFVRLNADGTMDTGFGSNGMVTLPASNDTSVYDALLMPDGKFLAAGEYAGKPTLWCLNSDGSLDSSFGSGGSVAQDISGSIRQVARTTEGRIRSIGSGMSEAGDYDIMLMQFYGPEILVNSDPVAADDAASTKKNTPVTVAVLDNDSDADGDTLVLQSVTSPAHGTAVINGDAVDYTPEQDYTGADSFDYVISDGNGGTDTAGVNITVNDPDPGDGGENLDVTGWWYTPGEGGTGLSIGMSDDKSTLFLAWYVYNSAGEALWYVAWCAETEDDTFTGDVRRYVGAPLGTYADEGDITLSFSDADSGTLSWNMSMLRANPGSKVIEKYMPTLDNGANDPVGFNGWWADSVNHPATGIFVEAKGDALYLGWYYYRDDNTPVWEVMGGFMDPDGFNPATGIYTATVKEISGGQTAGGDYQAPIIPDTGRPGTLTFAADGSFMTFTCGDKVYSLSPYTITMP